MKSVLFVSALLSTLILNAQDNIKDFLRAGVDNAERFSESYIAPAAEASVYNLANGWYNSGKVKKTFHFEISVVANAAFVSDDKQNFELNVGDYSNISFPDGAQRKSVATIFGENNPDQLVIIEYDTGIATETAEIKLPQGLGDSNINFVPSAYLQGSLGLIKGFELKARFLPEIEYDGTKTKLYGAALQHEFTNWLKGADLLPVAISGLIGYTRIDASYDLDESSIAGAGQEISSEMNSWVFSAIASTKLPVINFYGGLGFVSGNATTALKGSYIIDAGPSQGIELIDPYAIKTSINGINATLGFKLKLSFFRLNAAYSFQEYQNFNIGLNFGY
ncbi:DUF6588 family protein [Mesonia aestuariivivens]|uniref:DUF4421 domain-containing protein n=1 Tax=Mesonia aestuariivivens TaxID=2796128 RepID=A0ABS6W2T0_9FLAO|nr:DUF6588 family protein [Mesonia aestuariivivens]MBW2962155.1 hypothetical protein [Mesonia aestuariivivens]